VKAYHSVYTPVPNLFFLRSAACSGAQSTVAALVPRAQQLLAKTCLSVEVTWAGSRKLDATPAILGDRRPTCPKSFPGTLMLLSEWRRFRRFWRTGPYEGGIPSKFRRSVRRRPTLQGADPAVR